MSSHRYLIKPGRSILTCGVCRDVTLTASKGDDGRWSVWIDAAEHGRAGDMTRPEACAYIAGVLAGAQRVMQPALAAEAAAKARLAEMQDGIEAALSNATLEQLLDVLADRCDPADWKGIIDRLDLADDVLDATASDVLRDILDTRGDYEKPTSFDATDAIDDMRAGRKARARERVIEELERVARQ